MDHANGRPVDLSQYEILIHTSPLDACRAEVRDFIVAHGVSALLRRELLLEEVVPPGHPPTEIEKLLHSFITGIEVTTRLTIVDPYFLAASKDPGYAQTVCNVLAPFADTLEQLTIITLSKTFDPAVLAELKRGLAKKNPDLKVAHVGTVVFHDRYWLNPLSGKGFLSGTSLNGLGKRYAVLDYLTSSDVQAILAVVDEEVLRKAP